MMNVMSYFSENLKRVLADKAISVYTIWTSTEINETLAYNIVNGKRRPTDTVIDKLALFEPLGLDRMTLQTWRAVDDYGIDVLRKAVEMDQERRSTGQ